MEKKGKPSDKNKEKPVSSQSEQQIKGKKRKNKKKNASRSDATDDIVEQTSGLHLSSTHESSSDKHVFDKTPSQEHWSASSKPPQAQSVPPVQYSAAMQSQPRQPGPSMQSQQRQPGPFMQSQQRQPGPFMQSQQRQPGPSVPPVQYSAAMQSQPRQPGPFMQSQQRQPGPSMQSQQRQPGPSMQSQQRQPGPFMQSQQRQPGPSVPPVQYSAAMQSQPRQPGPFMQSQQRQPGPSVPPVQYSAAMQSQQRQPGSHIQDTSWRKITVATNYYPVRIDPKTVIYHYHVTITPDKPVKLLRKVWNEFCSKHFKNRIICFDGKTIALSKGRLEKNTFAAAVTIINPENNKEKEFKVEIEEVGFADYSNFERLDSFSKEIAFIEIILKNHAAENYLHTKKSFFPPNNKIVQLSERTHMRIGYFQSVILGHRPYLNFDISHMPFYNPCNVRQIFETMDKFDQSQINSFFSTLTVEYQFPNDPSSRRMYKVNKLVDNAKNQTFKKDGVEMKVSDYFKKEKNYNLKFPDFPLLWVGSKEKSIFLPMELCQIVPQFFRGLLSPDETRQMVRNCTSGALERKRNINESFNSIDWQNKYLKEFGISVSKEMENVEGRILNPPFLQTKTDIRVANGVWKTFEFSNPVTVKNWCVVNLDRYVRDNDIKNLENEIKNKARKLGIVISDPTKNFMKCSSNHNELKKIFQELKDMDIVFVIISEQDKGVYARVKTICETEKCVLTQCIKSRTLKTWSQNIQKMSETVGNILLKVNAKLGGENHCLSQKNLPQSLRGDVMIIGADVTHPSPGSSLPSVAAVAVSYDPDAFKYNISLRLQRKEIILNLTEIIKHHLSEFKKQRNRYPEKILIYRDGVSEGEVKQVKNEELGAIKKACLGWCDPKITFLIVSKRHHTRFFPLRKEDEDGSKNCNVPVGTCIDSVIVHPGDKEFFLLSHKSIQGTARPTRYYVLHNDNNFTINELKVATYYLCHMFARCNRSVSYPAPTYYAHLGAFRARSYLEEIYKKQSSEDLNKTQEKMKLVICQKAPMFFV